MLTPIGLDLLHLEIGGSLLHRGDAGELSNFKIKRFDCVEHVALVNKLVVNNPYIVDLTRYLGCDVRDLHTYGAIPRPGSRDILLPRKSGDQKRNERDGERGKVLGNLDKKISGSTARPRVGWSRRSQSRSSLASGSLSTNDVGAADRFAPSPPRSRAFASCASGVDAVSSETDIPDSLLTVAAPATRRSRCRD